MISSLINFIKSSSSSRLLFSFHVPGRLSCLDRVKVNLTGACSDLYFVSISLSVIADNSSSVTRKKSRQDCLLLIPCSHVNCFLLELCILHESTRLYFFCIV